MGKILSASSDIDAEREAIQNCHSISDPPILHSPENSQPPDGESLRDPAQPPKRPLWQLVLLNLVILGVEFCYAVETALVDLLLLQLGLPQSLYSLTWIVSPTLGFFLNPVLGSFSDRCSCAWGRRRPFILALCIGTVVGFTLFLNGEDIGRLVGDTAGSEFKY